MSIEDQAVDSPNSWAAKNAHQYIASDGTDVDHRYASDLILLYVKGRKSGVIRRIPLVASRDEGGWHIAASKGGSSKHPSWYLNVEANPEVWVRDGAELYEATATTLAGGSRDAEWARFKESWSVFAGYEQKTDREIPVVRLARKD